MSKNYTIDRTKNTGRWHWACNGGTPEGFTDTKQEAKQAGQQSCGVAFQTFPPDYNADFSAGI